MTRGSQTRLILAYALDWLLIACTAAFAGGISYITPYHRPFSLLDLSISFPNSPDQISTRVLVVVSLIIPAIIILFATTLLPSLLPSHTPTPTSTSSYNDPATPPRTKSPWTRRLWRLNASWLGLATSYVLALLLTQGIKNLLGKPRPDLLARCLPDLSTLSASVVGGYGTDISARWTLVSSAICTQPDKAVLDDGFRSFLSGHSSASFSGLGYFAQWLALEVGVGIPHVIPRTTTTRGEFSTGRTDRGNATATTAEDHNGAEEQNTPAAPPVWASLLVLFPICTAVFIAATRWHDFKHHGIDIVAGSALGILSAWVGFRMYHSSLRKGRARTWGPRAAEAAFWGVATAVEVGAGWQRGQNGIAHADEAGSRYGAGRTRSDIEEEEEAAKRAERVNPV